MTKYRKNKDKGEIIPSEGAVDDRNTYDGQLIGYGNPPIRP